VKVARAAAGLAQDSAIALAARVEVPADRAADWIDEWREF
jgi:hypothetical protein